MHAHATQEDTLGEVAKKAGGFALGALIGKGGSKFGGLDIKRVYFGCVFHFGSAAVAADLIARLRSQELVEGLQPGTHTALFVPSIGSDRKCSHVGRRCRWSPETPDPGVYRRSRTFRRNI